MAADTKERTTTKLDAEAIIRQQAGTKVTTKRKPKPAPKPEPEVLNVLDFCKVTLPQEGLFHRSRPTADPQACTLTGKVAVEVKTEDGSFKWVRKLERLS